ncbi:MAG: aldo/keto reductase [Bacteroidetes bacterium]|nr:aldo/keto reductase [Bacteroidota bacterium]
MIRQPLHHAGPTFSRIVAGAWRWHVVSGETISRLIHAALDAGITSFDHADIYGDHSNEEHFGAVIRKDSSIRNRMELITKCGIKFPSKKRPSAWIKHYDTSKQHIVWSVENSLQMLGTDRIDLLLIHRADPLLNPNEVAEAFTQLKDAGKVLHFGVSNFMPSQFRMLQRYLSFPLVTNQIEISLLKVDPLFNGELDFLMEMGVAPMAWSPLGGGKVLPVDERMLFNKAAKYNLTYSQMLLAWLLRHPSQIFPIIGTTQPDRIKEASKTINAVLDLQDWFEMLQWVTGKEVP